MTTLLHKALFSKSVHEGGEVMKRPKNQFMWFMDSKKWEKRIFGLRCSPGELLIYFNKMIC